MTQEQKTLILYKEDLLETSKSKHYKDIKLKDFKTFDEEKSIKVTHESAIILYVDYEYGTKILKNRFNGYTLSVQNSELLPDHYVDIDKPHYEGAGEHSVSQLETKCEQYESYIHNMQIKMQTLCSIFNIEIKN